LSRQATPIHRYLITSITGIIALPLVVIIAYFLFDSYQASLDRANFSVEQELEGKASQVTSKLQQLQYQIADFSRGRAVGEMAVNILLAQVAHNKMQELVESTPEVAAAFISDGSEFIIDGYPNKTYRMKTASVAKMSNEMMAKASVGQVPKLAMLPESTLFSDKENSQGQILVFTIPLFKELQSIVRPYKVTSVLFVQLDLSQILNNLKNYQGITLHFGEELLLASDELLNNDLVTASTTVSSVDMDSQAQRELALQIGIQRKDFLNRFRQHLAYALMFLVLTIGFVGILVYRLSTRLKYSVGELTQAARQFLQGDYKPVVANQDFAEFAESISAMNTMAFTIDAQIKNLSEAKLEAEKSEELKSQFLANMSHEIRTPMNGVLGLLLILQNKITDKEQLSLLKRISGSARSLLTIVNDILDLSKLEAGKLQIETVNFNAKQMLLNVVKTYAHTARQKGLQLKLDSKALSQPWWQGDPIRITQVLNNLLSNAVKFTEQGAVTIRILDLHEEGADWLVFCCEDSGIGLTEEQLSRLFNKFEQADNSTTRRFGGTGLGLSICKSLVEMMGGDISVTSQPGQGSEFRFKVKVTPGEPEKLTKTDNAMAPDFSGFKVLVAEDNAINQEILHYLLADTKIQAEYVENGIQAIESTRESPADVILMDVQMPEMSGVEATRVIRQEGYTMPIAMQTANVMKEEVDSYLQAGAQAHIAKPLEKHTLYNTLQMLLQRPADD